MARASVGAFAWSQTAHFARLHRWLIAGFAATSLLRIGTTVAALVLIRDFLASVLATPTGVAATLTAAVGQRSALLIVAAVLLAVFVASALAAYGSQMAMQRLSRLIELDLMETVITHLLRLPVAFFDQRHRGDLIESVRQDVTKTRSVASSLVEFTVYGAQAVAYTAAAMWLSPRLLLISLPVLAIGAAPTQWLVRRMRRRSRATRRHGYRLTDLLLQLVQGIRIVKIYAGEALETRNSIATARRYFEQLVSSARLKALGDVGLETAASFSVVAVIVAGGFEIMAGRLTMPRALWGSYTEKIAELLRPTAKKTGGDARMEGDGTATAEAVAVDRTRLLLNSLIGNSTDAVLFLPTDPDHWERGYPAKVMDIKLEDQKLTLTLSKLTKAEQDQLIQRIRSPFGEEPEPAITGPIPEKKEEE
jgi:ABC-type multidrug transport system fused ATPase/permease subunit